MHEERHEFKEEKREQKRKLRAAGLLPPKKKKKRETGSEEKSVPKKKGVKEKQKKKKPKQREVRVWRTPYGDAEIVNNKVVTKTRSNKKHRKKKRRAKDIDGRVMTQTQSNRLYTPEGTDYDTLAIGVTPDKGKRGDDDDDASSDYTNHSNSSIVEDDRVAFGNAHTLPEHHSDSDDDDISDPDMIIYNKEDMTNYSKPMKVNRMHPRVGSTSSRSSNFSSTGISQKSKLVN